MDHCSYCGKPMPLGCCSPWEDITVTNEPLPMPTRWASFKLMCLFMWDAVFHRIPQPPAWKREDDMHNGKGYSDE